MSDNEQKINSLGIFGAEWSSFQLNIVTLQNNTITTHNLMEMQAGKTNANNTNLVAFKHETPSHFF